MCQLSQPSALLAWCLRVTVGSEAKVEPDSVWSPRLEGPVRLLNCSAQLACYQLWEGLLAAAELWTPASRQCSCDDWRPHVNKEFKLHTVFLANVV